MSAPVIEFTTRRLADEELYKRAVRQGLSGPVFLHVASIYPDDGSNHHGEGETQAQALMRAAARWDSWEGAR